MGEILYNNPGATPTSETASTINPASQWPPPSTAIDYPAFLEMVKQNSGWQVGPGCITWRLNGEKVMVLGWGRAVLMQIAHPLVAEGVAAHSYFAHSAKAKLQRFQRTRDRMLQMTFGTPYEAWEAGQSIDHIHARVNGEATAEHPHYSAREPELLKWVHATFVDSMLQTYTRFVRPLSPQEKDEYIMQASLAGPLLGAPVGYFPSNLAELDSYMQAVLDSGILQVSPAARHIADYLLEPLPVPLLGQVLQWYGKLPVAGLLPPALRKGYGFKWSKLDEIALKGTAWAYRRIYPVLPAKLRRWSMALKAEKTIRS